MSAGTMNRLSFQRVLLWAVLLLFAAWFLAPLYVICLLYTSPSPRD